MNRRTFLGCATVSALGTLAGCSGSSPDSNSVTSPTTSPSPYADWHIRPDTAPATVPQELECPDAEFSRLPGIPTDTQVHWGDTESLDLRIDTLTAARGEEIRIELTNTTSESIDTGNRRKFYLELQTTDGWQPVRGASREEPVVYTDELVSHAPGEGFSWNMDLTNSGLAKVGKDLQVCPDLVSGRYRFAYWGLPGTDAAVAVAFDFQE